MSRSNSRLRTVVTIVIALLVVAAMVAPAALAHAQLLGSDPQDGASLPTTDRVVLTFNEEIDPDFVQVALTGPDGPLPLEAPVVEGAVLTQPMTPVSSGAHSLAYRVVSADGHPISGRVGFTLTDVVASAAESSTEPPTTPQRPTVMSDDDAVVTAVEDDGDGAGSGSPVLWLVAAAVLAVLAAFTAWWTRRHRHPEH